MSSAHASVRPCMMNCSSRMPHRATVTSGSSSAAPSRATTTVRVSPSG
jgi:hypothetical protein